MRQLLLGVVVEVLVAMLAAGIILGVAIPLLNRGGLIIVGDARSRSLIIGVVLLVLAVALFRPHSAIHRHIRR